MIVLHGSLLAQTWNTTGNAGTTPGTNFIGTTDAKDFVFKTNSIEKGRVKSSGLWQFGASGNLAKIDSAGNLSFVGNSAYKVAGNKYAFQYAGNPNYGLFFNSTNLLYEFRTSTALSVFSVGANSGNGIFKGPLKVGAYTLPSVDGTNGQVLKTNGTGTLTWSTDNGTAYSAGTGISFSGTTINSVWTLSGSNIYKNNSGNVGIGTTTPSALFEVGGADAKINGMTVGRGAGLITSNTAIGSDAFASNTIGVRNTAIGDSALFNNGNGAVNYAEGWVNTAVGASALKLNSIGYGNVALGSNAMEKSQTGILNTATGYYALSNNTIGSRNVAMGNAALYLNSEGILNTALGSAAMWSNTTGTGNVAVGNRTLYSTSTVSDLVAVGNQSLYSNTSGQYNTAVGSKSLYSNQTGGGNVAIGDNAMYLNFDGGGNVVVGHEAGYSNTSGGSNVAVGNAALNYNSSGSFNCALGEASLFNTTGDWNTAVGHQALMGNTTGTNNTALGRNADVAAINLNNATVIGANAYVNQHNTMSFGSSTVTNWAFGLPSCGAGQAIKVGNSAANGNGAFLTSGGVWTNSSDENIKENFTKLNADEVLSKINELKIPSWNYKGSVISEKHIGPMAQQFYDLFGTGLEGDREHISTIDPAGVALIGIQALSLQNDSLKQTNTELIYQIDDQQKQIDELKNQMLQFENALSQCCTNFQSTSSVANMPPIDLPVLEQNIPNPFSQSSYIKFYIPSSFKSAMIVVSDIQGKEIKRFNNLRAGFGTVTMQGGQLASGTYEYSLYNDGVKVDTKQMILTK